MIILGIDPGIADTGYGVIEVQKNNTIKCLAYGSIKTNSNQGLGERLEILYKELNIIIEEFKPYLVSVEELFFYNNAKTAFVVSQARGVVLLAIQQNKLKIAEFTPLQVKQAVSTYGKADKKQVQKMIKLILSLETIPTPDDAADALAVAICASNQNWDYLEVKIPTKS
ncbi:crossover junction endodeoxyribonuclease RuvC [Patescibacteria group bacterium]|nr:crossover junction endodeoxyribonuclease RuvC [Patescibacteria group bacterium]